MDEEIEVDVVVSENADITLLAQYDAVCRNFVVPGCDTGNNLTHPYKQPFFVLIIYLVLTFYLCRILTVRSKSRGMSFEVASRPERNCSREIRVEGGEGVF